MTGKKRILTILVCAGAALLPAACEQAVEETVVAPVNQALEARDKAALEAALANARMVRDALVRYPAVSAENKYPTSREISDYQTLRSTLDVGLPADMAELRWDPGWGLNYRSDGYSFTLEVNALTSRSERITITEGRVTW